MTTLTLAFTEDFNTVAGRLRQLGAKFTTRGSGATRTLVFSNMPESVLSIVRQWIERSSEAPGKEEENRESEKPKVPETETVSPATAEVPETGETEAVSAAVAEPSAVGEDDAGAETEEIVESPCRRYERPELEEMTKNAILSLGEELAIDLSPVLKKKKAEIIDRFLELQG